MCKLGSVGPVRQRRNSPEQAPDSTRSDPRSGPCETYKLRQARTGNPPQELASGLLQSAWMGFSVTAHLDLDNPAPYATPLLAESSHPLQGVR